jgi:mannitol/fructose-specific phosphotransferase system IIA component
MSLSGITLLALTGCSNFGSGPPSSDLREVAGIIDSKVNFLELIRNKSGSGAVNSGLLADIATQTEGHIKALIELTGASAAPSPSSEASSTQSLSQICEALKDDHAKVATKLSDPDIARVVIQISASENVHSIQLSVANL